ncbi:hypothetical protein NO2_0637 [Candidatus Termititenax persephonae]|uniref:Uncharacterized protein n=1 Tax=Candidatus Termititenax persephonae TaxID=2218525 RepID=A0A388TGM3_9BACT|nr:hypothetical protein NO2_0637 [Candidatus Termititenax persephonae]
MPKRKTKKPCRSKARDEILLRHITTGKIGCGVHQNKIKYSRQRNKLETKNIAAEEQNASA